MSKALILLGSLLISPVRADFNWLGSWSAWPLGTGASSYTIGPDLVDGGSLSGQASVYLQTDPSARVPHGGQLMGDLEAGTGFHRSFSLSGSSPQWQLDFGVDLTGLAQGLHGHGNVYLTVVLDGQGQRQTFVAGGSGGGGGLSTTILDRSTRSMITGPGLYDLTIYNRIFPDLAPLDFRGFWNFGAADDRFSLSIQATSVPEIVPSSGILLGVVGGSLMSWILVRRANGRHQ